MPTYPTVSRTFRGPQSTAIAPSYTPEDVNAAALKIVKMQQDQAEEEAKRTATQAYRDKSLDLRKQSFDIYKKSIEQRDAAQKAMAPIREAQLKQANLAISKAEDEDKRRIAAQKRLRVAEALEIGGPAYERELKFVAEKFPELANATPEQRKEYAAGLRREAAAIHSPATALQMWQQSSEADKRRMADAAEAKAKAEADAVKVKPTPLQEKAKVQAALAPISNLLRLTPVMKGGKMVAGTAVSPAAMATLVQALQDGVPLATAADVAGIEVKPSAKFAEAEKALNDAKIAADKWFSGDDAKLALQKAQTAYDAAAEEDARALSSIVWDENTGKIVDRRVSDIEPHTAMPLEESASVRDVVRGTVDGAMKQRQEQAAAQAEAQRPATIEDKYNYLAEMLKSGVNAETGSPLDEAAKTKIKAAMNIYKKRMMPQQ